jgi:hypothetical protein
MTLIAYPNPYDPLRGSQQDRAVANSPGQGMPEKRLNWRWCCKCEKQRDTLGGRIRGSLFVCAQCRGGKE